MLQRIDNSLLKSILFTTLDFSIFTLLRKKVKFKWSLVLSDFLPYIPSCRRDGRAVMQRIANPSTTYLGRFYQSFKTNDHTLLYTKFDFIQDIQSKFLYEKFTILKTTHLQRIEKQERKKRSYKISLVDLKSTDIRRFIFAYKLLMFQFYYVLNF